MVPLNQLLVYFIFVAANTCLASQVLRPRGVSLVKASLYDPGHDFSCFDGSGKVPFQYVNDDYCDCRDGSDEPGTAACPNGSFHCANIGYMAMEIRSSRVNDGVCDCCDASDEWATGANCQDICHDVGKVAMEEARQKEHEAKKGYTLKLGMIEQAKNIKADKENKIASIKAELETAEATKAERETEKQRLEEPESLALEQYRDAEEAKKEADAAAKKVKSEAEAQEVFNELDSDGDGTMTKQELQADTAYDTNRDGEVSDDEAAFYLQQEDSMDFQAFYTRSWRLMRPAHTFARKQGGGAQGTPPSMFTPPSTPPPPPPPPPAQQTAEPVTEQPEQEQARDDGAGQDEEGGAGDEEGGAGDEEDDTQALDEDEDEDDESEYEGEDYNIEDVEKEDKEEDGGSEVVYDEVTQALVDAAKAARESYQEAASQVKDLNKELMDQQDSLSKDFGPDNEYRVLDGSCFEYGDREYTYRLCVFSKATQTSKNGGGETRLGTWEDWGQEEGEERYYSMRYTNGQGCWNGPNRSTVVKLECGVEHKLIGATEPSKCEYHFVFSTPAACAPGDDSAPVEAPEEQDDQHTEL